MKTFHCTACQALVFFENTQCLNCGRALAFSPDRMLMVTVSQAEDGLWRSVEGEVEARRDEDASPYRLCANYAEHGVCNWALPDDSAQSLCRSCALTHTIPNLSEPGSQEAWFKLETAKRRLVYSLLSLELPLISKEDDAKRGLRFLFLSDAPSVQGDQSRVLTGHDNGVITINAAESDDVYRETQRQQHHEPYRTLLGHFRHEVGHYYWDQLIAANAREVQFRDLFGDERADYQQALKRHYEQGAPANWSDNYISAYATMHPWEDWAESWAHVMHIVDALETAQSMGLSVKPVRGDEPSLSIAAKPTGVRIIDADQLIKQWKSLTYVLNNLTRGLGLADAYPFVLSDPVIAKLKFVCSCLVDAASPRQDCPAQIAEPQLAPA